MDRLLSGYLSQLELVARKPSKYQQTAAHLASQAHHSGAIITFHRGRMRAREHHCRQALEYAAVAADIPSQVSALLTLGSTYFFGDDPVRAVQTYEKAPTFDSEEGRCCGRGPERSWPESTANPGTSANPGVG